MASFASQSASLAGVLALGDNFYNLGLCNNRTLAPYNATCPNASSPLTGTAQDPRFHVGFEEVYGAEPSLKTLPFYVIAGNHDALGNVSASIAYSALSPGRQWRHPDFYYRLQLGAVEVFMLDTTLCYGIWSDPTHDAMCAAQLAWLEAGLAASTAPFLLVAGHYPIFSPCAHGNTQWAIDTLLPLLLRFNATAYLSGHDHCGAFLAPQSTGDLVFAVTGTGDGCCYNESNILAVPAGGSLKFLLSSGYNPHGAPSGFATLSLTSFSLSFSFYSAAGGQAGLLYTSPQVLPRVPLRNASGAVVAMAAPSYAAAGLPRPSAVAPSAPYPQPPPSGKMAAVDFHHWPTGGAAGGSTATSTSSASASSSGAELVLWLYAPQATRNDTWAAWYSDLQAHRENVTGVAPCSYLVTSSGEFVSQMPSNETAALAKWWTRRMAADLGLSVLPLIAASGTGMNALIRSGNGAAAAAFIAATVAELRAVNGAGYNVQLEEPGNETIKEEWEGFLGAWADALAPATISMIIGGDCRGRDWMYMDCGDYKLLQRNHSNLRAITEATYTKEPSAWMEFERNIVRGLGLPVAQLGLEYGPPLDNPLNGCLPQARASGVRALYVWVNPPEGAGNQSAWDAFGWWLSG